MLARPLRSVAPLALLPAFALPSVLSIGGCGLEIDDENAGDVPGASIPGPPTIAPGSGRLVASSGSSTVDGPPPVVGFAGPMAPSECGGDPDCPAGCVCLEATCVETGVCDDDGRCPGEQDECDPDRWTCRAASPTPTVATSPPGSGAAAGEEGPAGGQPLELDSPDSALCDDGSDRCADRASVCLSNDECGDGLCVNNECRSFCDTDDQCLEGEACLLGVCRRDAASWECIDESDCPDADDCVGGSCLRRCLADRHCLDCDDGPSCSFGYCGP